MRTMYCLILTGSLLAVSPVAGADSEGERIAEIQAEIDAAGLSWTAGKTSMTALTEEEFRARLIPLDQYEKMMEQARTTLPTQGPPPRDFAPGSPLPPPDDETFDWSNVGGEDWTSPVRDQGQCGSCTIFAGVAAIEGAINVSAQDPDLDWDLSEQNLLDCTEVTCESGGMGANVALNYAGIRGVPDELCHPYTQSDGDCHDDGCEDVLERSLVASDWDWVANGNLSSTPTVLQMKNALSYGPVGTSMTVYADFQAYSGGVYVPGPSSAELGGHSIAIVGWNDANDSWYVKNSWGPLWGNDGFFEIKRGEAGIGQAMTSWITVDPADVPGSFEVQPDQIVTTLDWTADASPTQTVTIQHSAGSGEVPFSISIPESIGWLSVDPAQGNLLDDTEVEVTFTFDKAGWDPTDGSTIETALVVLGPPGFARALSINMTVTGYTGGDDAGADGGGDSDSDSCNCGMVGSAGSPGGLLALVFSSVLF